MLGPCYLERCYLKLRYLELYYLKTERLFFDFAAVYLETERLQGRAPVTR